MVLGVKSYFEVYDDEAAGFDYVNDEIHIASHIEPLEEELLDDLKKQYGYYADYSKMAGMTYLLNHCSNCKMKQGDYFLFEEVDSPFFLDTVDKVKQLTLRKIPLKNDVIANIDVGYGSTDWMIEQYAKFM